MESMLPSDTTTVHTVTVGNRGKSYSDVVIEGVIEGVMRKVKSFVGYSIVKKTSKAFNKGATW